MTNAYESPGGVRLGGAALDLAQVDRVEPVPVGGVVRHGIAYVGPGRACVCARHDCGGVVPVSSRAEHGDAVRLVMERHPGGGVRCADLSTKRSAVVEGTADLSSASGCGAGRGQWK
ncbi:MULTISPECIES: hypothetical protein [unclassified Streptomyces]|uniref:hypothetical protein n=1 Tax=unclassified Streptomyces TaxID=2593676 RepID=UPI0004BD8A74|nr:MULTISPECIES: hypothetical protein [unclassified Streptomyces]